MHITGSICLLYAEAMMTWVNPLLTELSCFQVFCGISPRHRSSCCRAPGVVWLVPLHCMSVTVSRSPTGAWRKSCWELLNVLLPFLLSLKKDHNLTFFWWYLFYIWFFVLIQILLSYNVKISLYFKNSPVIYESVKHFFSWMTSKDLCLQVSLREMGYLKQNLFASERRKMLWIWMTCQNVNQIVTRMWQLFRS